MTEKDSGIITELVFLLDRSGSMGGLESDTIGGFNAMLEKQKKEDGRCLVTTVLFDDRIEFLTKRKDIAMVRPLTEKEYYVRGCTALLDAIGKTIAYISDSQRKDPKQERPDRTLFVITTDGLENASRKYRYEDIRRSISARKEASGWEFLFLGANMDAIKEAASLGIDSSRAVTYLNDSDGVRENFKAMGAAISGFRSASMEEPSAAFDDGSWKADIERDFSARSGKKKR